jgi:hypothetical protein
MCVPERAAIYLMSIISSGSSSTDSLQQRNNDAFEVPEPLFPSSLFRVGYVPEHFLTPVLLAHQHNLFPSPIALHPCPSGTGQMLERLKNKEIGIYRLF